MIPAGLKNWKTLICGVVAAAGGIASQFPEFVPYAHAISNLGTLALGYFAADAGSGKGSP